jgi:hypothetical protein
VLKAGHERGFVHEAGGDVRLALEALGAAQVAGVGQLDAADDARGGLGCGAHDQKLGLFLILQEKTKNNIIKKWVLFLFSGDVRSSCPFIQQEIPPNSVSTPWFAFENWISHPIAIFLLAHP